MNAHINHINDIDTLLLISKRIDGSGYGATRNLLGTYAFDENILLTIDYIPRDPQESIPGKIRLFIPYEKLRYNKNLILKDNFGKLAAKHFFTELTYKVLTAFDEVIFTLWFG